MLGSTREPGGAGWIAREPRRRKRDSAACPLRPHPLPGLLPTHRNGLRSGISGWVRGGHHTGDLADPGAAARGTVCLHARHRRMLEGRPPARHAGSFPFPGQAHPAIERHSPHRHDPRHCGWPARAVRATVHGDADALHGSGAGGAAAGERSEGDYRDVGWPCSPEGFRPDAATPAAGSGPGALKQAEITGGGGGATGRAYWALAERGPMLWIFGGRRRRALDRVLPLRRGAPILSQRKLGVFPARHRRTAYSSLGGVGAGVSRTMFPGTQGVQPHRNRRLRRVLYWQLAHSLPAWGTTAGLQAT